MRLVTNDRFAGKVGGRGRTFVLSIESAPHPVPIGGPATCERGGDGATARARAAGGHRRRRQGQTRGDAPGGTARAAQTRSRQGNGRGETEGTRLPPGHPGDAGAGRRHGGHLPPVPVAAHRRLRRRGRLLRDLRVPDHRSPAARVPQDRQGRPARLLGTAGQAARARGGPRADRDLGGLAAAAAGDAAGGHRRPRSGRARCTTRTGSSRGTRSTTSSRTARRARCSTSGRCRWRSSSTWAGRCCSSSRRSWRSRRGGRDAKACPRAPRGPAPRGRGRRRLALVLGLLHARQPGGRLLRDDHPDLGARPRRPARAAARGAQPADRPARRARLGRARPGDRVGVRAERHQRLPRVPRPAARRRRRGC